MQTRFFSELWPGAVFVVGGVRYVRIRELRSDHRYNVVRLDNGQPWFLPESYPVEVDA